MPWHRHRRCGTSAASGGRSTRTPSSSDSAPATTAAAASPRECPMTAPGRTPYAFMVAARATCMVNSVGWIRSMTGHDLRAPTSPRSPRTRTRGRSAARPARRWRRTPVRSPAAQRPSPPTANPARRTPTPDPDRRARPRPDTEYRRRRPRATPRSAPAWLLAMTAVRTGRCARRRARV